MVREASAAEITRKAKSNLAFALRCLPPDRRRHLVNFYAFCRVIDDLADDAELALGDKEEGLAKWKEVLVDGKKDESLGYGDLQEALFEMRANYQISVEYFVNLIEGCELDLRPQRFERWEDLQGYTYRVACSVGLVCLPLFGANAERSHDYAVALGHALQLTNILRDVGEDLAMEGRIYLPLGEFERFQYGENDLIGEIYDERFVAMMGFQAERCEELFRQAAACLPKEDRRALLAPRIMHRIYHRLLAKMKKDEFRVFDRRYRVGKVEKIFLFLRESCA